MTRFLAVAAILLATQAHAAPPCMPHDIMVEQLKQRFGETRIMLGGNASSVTEIFHNPETGSWTLVITGTNGWSCIRSAGTGIQFNAQVEPEEGT